MDRAYYVLLAAVLIGLGYRVLFRRTRSNQKSQWGWIVFGAIATLVLGLVVAGNAGNEKLTWLFGVLLMVMLPIMFFMAIGSAIASLFRRDSTKDHHAK